MSKTKDLYCESKTRLGERIAGNVSSCASIARQVIRGSKSSDLLSQSAKNFASHEYFIENTENNLKKMNLVSNQMNIQLSLILVSTCIF
ncbi:hypothetical protein B4U80_11364 [Leptotrombidium deliense]|uniref:BLOC-1-related complex subunit 7 n=1 Tax=Leptotrombidium deliense TaxID=299467 RepID=A0A443S746_9ACAR|nr:hypothetical protein B4U80_11364 [Leptotrombidium deliense]